jgi:hypothetical protein
MATNNRALQELMSLQQKTDQALPGGFMDMMFGPSAQDKLDLNRAMSDEEQGRQDVQRGEDAFDLMNMVTDRQVPMSMEQGQNLQNTLASADPATQKMGMNALQNIDPRQVTQTPVQQVQLENARLQQQGLQQALELGEATGQNTIFTQEGALRDDAAQGLKQPAEFLTAYNQVKELIQLDDPLAFTASVIKLAKALDPTSAVREGEVTTVAGGTGLAQSMINSMNQAVGNGMTPEARSQFMNVVGALAGPQAQSATRIFDGVIAQANEHGINPAYALSSTGIDEAQMRSLAGMPTQNQEPVVIDLTGSGGPIQRR